MNPYSLFKITILTLLALSTLNVCAQPKTPKIDLQGHRGCRGLYPENTLVAMMEALKIGVTTLELDVVITKDKQVVLSHEPFMSSEIATTPDGNNFTSSEEKEFNIYEMNYAQLQQWDVGLKQHPRFPSQHKMAASKPLLSSFIDSVEHYIQIHRLKPVKYNIETKSDPSGDDIFHPKPQEFVDLLMKVLREKKILDRVIIQSFDVRTLQILHQQNPKIKLAYLLEDTSTSVLEDQINKLGFTPDILSPEYHFVNPELIEICRKKKMGVIVWTVNDLADIQKMAKMGVSGIISDYPNLFIDAGLLKSR